MTPTHKTPLAAARRLMGLCLTPVLRQAARAYVAGDYLDDALRIRRKVALQGAGCTVGFFNTEEHAPAEVTEHYLQGIEALRGSEDYLSIKLPALGFDPVLLHPVARAAADAGVRLHFDSLGPEAADATRRCIDDLLARGGVAPMGITLPGRWKRSLADGAWAAERGLSVRIVKGQWPDDQDASRDLAEGFLQVVDTVAGRARQVAVASHDVPLAEKALRRLRAAGTPCELELLYGLPTRESLEMAERLRAPVRFYIPYGVAHLPYVVAKAMESPYLIRWLLRDLCASALGRA